MGELFAGLDWPDATIWAFFAAGFCLAALAETAGHIRRAWHSWWLDRRLARDPWILREELKQHQLDIGEELPPLDPARVVAVSLARGAMVAVVVWLFKEGFAHWLDYGHWLLGGAALLFGIWRRLNDPPEMRLEPEDSPIPALRAFLAERDAVLGLGLAVIAVVVILALVTMVF